MQIYKKEVNHDDPLLLSLIILIISHGCFQILDDDFQRFKFRWSAILEQLRYLACVDAGYCWYVRPQHRIR